MCGEMGKRKAVVRIVYIPGLATHCIWAELARTSTIVHSKFQPITSSSAGAGLSSSVTRLLNVELSNHLGSSRRSRAPSLRFISNISNMSWTQVRTTYPAGNVSLGVTFFTTSQYAFAKCDCRPYLVIEQRQVYRGNIRFRRWLGLPVFYHRSWRRV